MIKVHIEVEIDGIKLEYEREEYGSIAHSQAGILADKAESLLLDGYHKMTKAIASQR